MKKRLYWLAIERRNLQNASAVHATSDGEGRDVRRLGLMDPSRIFAIPLGIDPMGWTEDHQPDRLRKLCGGRAGDRPIILYLSRLHPKKGIVDLLLPAMARLKSDAFLAIVGASDERTPKYDTEIRAEVERLGIASRIAILGGVAACDRWTIFDGAVGFVLPSHNENFGIVVVEAMARGLPVVVTDAVQAATQVRAAGAGHVVPFDADALADRLDALVAQPSAARSAGQAGQEYVRKHLGWEGIAGEISTMYRSCLI